MRRVHHPLNTTGRTKAQIVAEAEATWMLPALLGDVQDHNADCRCLPCFHRHADYVIALGEMYANV